MLIKTVLFDVDGVFLSEERCFDASALSVWELLHSADYVGLGGESFTVTPSEEAIRRIRNTVFANDATLNFVKKRGINSNWDMVFLTVSHQLLLLMKALWPYQKELVHELLTHPIGPSELKQLGQAVREVGMTFKPNYDAFVDDFSKTAVEKQQLLLYLNDLSYEWFGVKTDCFSRKSTLWELGMAAFQEWYLGDPFFAQMMKRPPRASGKTGFLENEIPLAEPERIRSLLHELKDEGFTLGIGTGRPYLETEVPFKALGLWELFNLDHVATASDVIRAETAYPEQAPLGKPQPFTYVKALQGRDSSDEAAVFARLPVPDSREILIVGDSVADLMAARSMGCQFAATLTGLSGQAARETFEKLGADYICDDILDIRHVLLNKSA